MLTSLHIKWINECMNEGVSEWMNECSTMCVRSEREWWSLIMQWFTYFRTSFHSTCPSNILEHHYNEREREREMSTCTNVTKLTVIFWRGRVFHRSSHKANRVPPNLQNTRNRDNTTPPTLPAPSSPRAMVVGGPATSSSYNKSDP